MPEFMIVVSDPKAGKAPVARVKVVGKEDIEVSKDELEKRKLPAARINPALAEKLGLKETRVLTLRIKGGEGKKVNLTVRAIEDPSVPEDEVWVGAELLIERIDAEEAEAEAFRSKAWTVVLSDPQASRLVGMRIGESFDGELVGLPGLKLEIRGGSDNSGFPMRPDVHGGVKKRILVSGPPGFHPREKGERRRKMVRGNTITADIVQINAKILYPGERQGT
jgi:small subunit ribosomal protein S6e